ncbi:hypothetical protein [Mycetohabitans endofungorum]|uniref:hypothetical protein n=1 Tax=Mycetohabitans endofungorum TaxID=417203 RepID=UPI002B061AA4|nr:hypothetical protein [Mycetohabitans endofungorum]
MFRPRQMCAEEFLATARPVRRDSRAAKLKRDGPQTGCLGANAGQLGKGEQADEINGSGAKTVTPE